MQEIRYAGQVGCRREGMQDRWDEGHDGCSISGMQERRETGFEGCMTGGYLHDRRKQERMETGKK